MIIEPGELFAYYTRSKEDVYKLLARSMIDRDSCLDVLSRSKGSLPKDCLPGVLIGASLRYRMSLVVLADGQEYLM